MGLETIRIHLREIDGCVLAGAREDGHGEQVNQLIQACQRGGEAMVILTFPCWIAVVVKIKDPSLEFSILFTC